MYDPDLHLFPPSLSYVFARLSLSFYFSFFLVCVKGVPILLHNLFILTIVHSLLSSPISSVSSIVRSDFRKPPVFKVFVFTQSKPRLKIVRLRNTAVSTRWILNVSRGFNSSGNYVLFAFGGCLTTYSQNARTSLRSVRLVILPLL